MNTRKRAMEWWNILSSGYKTQLCDTNTEIVGHVRRWETLTGREIEQIYNIEVKPSVSKDEDDPRSIY